MSRSSYVTTLFSLPPSNLMPIMNFSWSTPLRRNGQTDLPLIPNEIYLHIFQCIAPTHRPLSEEYVQTFSALALVCRFFCSVALPRVFERVTFSGNKYDKSNRILASRKTKWARLILAHAEPATSFALNVKECIFKYWEFNDEGKLKWPFAMPTLYCQAMARMSNIRKVVFSYSFIKADHWDALAELKQLDVLEFRFCSFKEDPPDKQLTVRTIWLRSGSHESPSHLTLRPIPTTSLRSLEMDDVGVALKIVAFRQLAIVNLVLEQRSSNMESLFRVFRHLPGLRTVTVWLSSRALASKLPLKKLFTRLHSFSVRRIGFPVVQDTVEMLISNLCDGPGTLPSLKELNIYLGCTTTLDIFHDDYLNGTIVPAFPNVRRINTDAGFMRLEEGNWKVHSYSN